MIPRGSWITKAIQYLCLRDLKRSAEGEVRRLVRWHDESRHAYPTPARVV